MWYVNTEAIMRIKKSITLITISPAVKPLTIVGSVEVLCA